MYDDDQEAGFERIRTRAEKRKLERKAPKPKPVRTYEEIEKAVWQYLLDHSTPHPRGYAISFVMVSKADFFRRVEARRSGAFKRYEEKVIANDVKKVQRSAAFVEQRAQKFNRAKKNGPWYLKLAIALRKRLTKFIEKHAT